MATEKAEAAFQRFRFFI